MKYFMVTVNASPRYPIKEVFTIEASGWSTAIARGVKEYFKKHKNFRTSYCSVRADKIPGLLKEKEEA